MKERLLDSRSYCKVTNGRLCTELDTFTINNVDKNKVNIPYIMTTLIAFNLHECYYLR